MAASYLHRINRRALVYAAIPVLAGVWDASAAWSHQANRSALDGLAIFAPRIGFALILALVVYGLFIAARSALARLNGVALAAQPTWHFMTSAAR
ncbi:MAG: hypothetical protein ACM3MH_10310 [Actinomycetota bacterium]